MGRDSPFFFLVTHMLYIKTAIWDLQMSRNYTRTINITGPWERGMVWQLGKIFHTLFLPEISYHSKLKLKLQKKMFDIVYYYYSKRVSLDGLMNLLYRQAIPEVQRGTHRVYRKTWELGLLDLKCNFAPKNCNKVLSNLRHFN